MATIEDAIALATEAHRGQTRPDGSAYILHPLRVMLALQDDLDQVVGVLHDVVEDTPVTLDDLRRRGYDPEVVEAVDHLSRREGETYEAFVERVAPHPRARRVKLADLADNMDVRRLKHFSSKDAERMARYHRAWHRLTDQDRSGARVV
jgi:(p)ppGpp synthase/HD superfamily hydrolase